jgi:hypothetical protein
VAFALRDSLLLELPEILPEAPATVNYQFGALAAEGRKANQAMACGTSAPYEGEQAAEGQTAGLSFGMPRGCERPSLLTLDLGRGGNDCFKDWLYLAT